MSASRPPSAAGSTPVTERQAWKALAALCVGLFMTLLDQSLVAVALPQLQDDLGTGINQAVWVSAVYLLTFAAPLLITGRLGDRFGQRRVYLVGMVVFVLAALASATAPGVPVGATASDRYLPNRCRRSADLHGGCLRCGRHSAAGP